MAGQLMAPRSDVTLGTRPLLVLALTLIAVALYAYIGDVRLQTFLSLLYIIVWRDKLSCGARARPASVLSPALICVRAQRAGLMALHLMHYKH
jgi:hypothetical protein